MNIHNNLENSLQNQNLLNNGYSAWRPPIRVDGGGFNLFLLQNLADYFEWFNFWELAEAANEAPVKQNTEATKSANEAEQSPKPKAPAEKLNVEKRPPVAENADKIEAQTRQLSPKNNENLERLAPTPKPLERPNEAGAAMKPDLNLESLTPTQQGWVMQWLQQLQGPPQSLAKGAESQAAKAVENTQQSQPGKQESRGAHAPKQANKPPGPTPTERYEFLKALQHKMEEAYKQGKPFRVQMDAENSVILRVQKGRVSAEFLVPAVTKEALSHLNQQLEALRQRMASKKLGVGQLSIRAERAGNMVDSATDAPPRRQKPREKQ